MFDGIRKRMVEEDKRLVITLDFYRVNKVWLDTKAEKDERTKEAITNLKTAIKIKIIELEGLIANFDLTEKKREIYYSIERERKQDWEIWQKEKGHKKDYKALLNGKLNVYKSLLKGTK